MYNSAIDEISANQWGIKTSWKNWKTVLLPYTVVLSIQHRSCFIYMLYLHETKCERQTHCGCTSYFINCGSLLTGFGQHIHFRPKDLQDIQYKHSHTKIQV